MGKNKGIVTIDDVAKEAGVAKSTVSRVINGADGVKPATRNKVNRAIDSLQFTPNIMARSLKTKLRRQIALAIDDIRNPYYPELAWAAEQVAKQNDFRLVLINHYGNPSEELAVIREANDMHVDGIILHSISHPKTLKTAIDKASVSVCLIGSHDENIAADMVKLTRPEGFLAAEHLIRIGRTRIAYAGGPLQLHHGMRYAAYEQTLASHFMKPDPSLVHIGDSLSIQTGIAAAERFARLDPMPDAIFAANDLIAIGIIQTLSDMGIAVPEQIAVIGIDDIKWCTLIRPKVSSVSNLTAEMGRIAVELLLKRIESPNERDYQRIELEPRLIVRESTVKTV